MNKRFFEPCIGKNFNEGINGKKVLVLGASFYCPHTCCQFHNECTSREKKDSSDYDLICPDYNKDGETCSLSNSPFYELDEQYNTYKKFARAMTNFLHDNVHENFYTDFWDKVAFTNFVQFFLPSWETLPSDCTGRDLDALREVIEMLHPDVVIIWGHVTKYAIIEPFCYDVKTNTTDGYIYHSNAFGHKEITFLNTYHPSYTKFLDNGLLEKYVKEVFGQ